MELLGGERDLKVSSFVVDFEVEFTLALVNVKGFFWALREPKDSNRSFPVISTPNIFFAGFETLQHMLDFRSSVSCFGLG